MESKIVFLLVLLHLWHFAMPNPKVDDLSQLKDANQTIIKKMDFFESETKFPIQIGNKFYRVSTDTPNWFQAAHNCRQLGGHLLNIESSEEMDALLSIIPSDRYWTSANCLAKDREWISISTGEAMPYLRWFSYEPNNLFLTEYCVEIKMTNLNDEVCANELKYICEAKVI